MRLFFLLALALMCAVGHAQVINLTAANGDPIGIQLDEITLVRPLNNGGAVVQYGDPAISLNVQNEVEDIAGLACGKLIQLDIKEKPGNSKVTAGVLIPVLQITKHSSNAAGKGLLSVRGPRNKITVYETVDSYATVAALVETCFTGSGGGGGSVAIPLQRIPFGTGPGLTSNAGFVTNGTAVGISNNGEALTGLLKLGSVAGNGRYNWLVNSTASYDVSYNLTDTSSSWNVSNVGRNHQLLGPSGRNRMSVDNNGFLLLGAQGTYPKVQLPMAYSGMRHSLLAANAPELGEGQHLILGCNYPGIAGYNAARNSLSFNIEVFDDDGLTYYNESYMSFKRATTGQFYRPWAFKFNENVPYPAAGGPVTVVNQFMGQTIFTAATKSEAELGVSGAIIAMMIDTSNTGSATTGGLVNMGASTTRNQSKLEVSANDAVNSTLKLLTSNSVIHPRIGFSFDNGTNTKEYAEVGMIPIDGTVGAEAGSLEFKTRNSGTLTQRMVISWDGKVGIATASPSQPLHVVGNARVTGAIYDSNNSPGASGEVLSSTVTGTDWVAASGGGTYTAGTGISIVSNVVSVQGVAKWGFYGDPVTGKLANSFHFQHDGKNTQLGNTNLPTKTRLDVYSSSTLNPNVLLLSDGADVVQELGFGYMNDTAKVSYSRLVSTATVGTLNAETGYFEIKTRTAGTDIVAARFDNGKVGIGATGAPSQTLHVAGNARVTGAIYDSNNSPGSSGEVLSSTVTGTDWITPPGGALSSLTAATTTNTINNAANTQTWNWTSATTQTGMVMNANGMTTGGLIQLSSTNNSLNSTNGLLTVRNAGTSTSGMLATFAANSTSGTGVYITTANTVGVGTLTPTHTLDVSGSARTRGLVIRDWFDITGTGTVTASSTISLNRYDNGDQGTLQVNLPASPFDGQLCTLMFFDAVTTLTISGNGNTIFGAALTTAALGTTATYVFSTGDGWIRQ